MEEILLINNFFNRLENFFESLDETVEILIQNIILFFNEEIITEYPIETPIILKKKINTRVLYKMTKIHILKQKVKKNYHLVIKEILNNKFKIKYQLVLNELLIKKPLISKTIIELTPTQKIIGKTLINKNCVIIYLGLFYNFETNKWDKLELLKEIVHTSIKLKIPVIILGENNPINFIPKLNQALEAFFSNSNYITPYHYKKRWFDHPIKLPCNKVLLKPCKISLKQMVDDIIDQYQLENNVYTILKVFDINFG